MKRFYLRYVNADENLRQAIAVLPWGHNLLILNKDLSDVQVALQDVNKPIGVAEYQYLLPKEQILQIVSSELKKSSK